MIGNGARVERDEQIAAGAVIELRGATAARMSLAAPPHEARVTRRAA
jgi:hypothetical protein